MGLQLRTLEWAVDRLVLEKSDLSLFMSKNWTEFLSGLVFKTLEFCHQIILF